jgi:hypothetical protein
MSAITSVDGRRRTLTTVHECDPMCARHGSCEDRGDNVYKSGLDPRRKRDCYTIIYGLGIC